MEEQKVPEVTTDQETGWIQTMQECVKVGEDTIVALKKEKAKCKSELVGARAELCLAAEELAVMQDRVTGRDNGVNKLADVQKCVSLADTIGLRVGRRMLEGFGYHRMHPNLKYSLTSTNGAFNNEVLGMFEETWVESPGISSLPQDFEKIRDELLSTVTSGVRVYYDYSEFCIPQEWLAIGWIYQWGMWIGAPSHEVVMEYWDCDDRTKVRDFQDYLDSRESVKEALKGPVLVDIPQPYAVFGQITM